MEAAGEVQKNLVGMVSVRDPATLMILPTVTPGRNDAGKNCMPKAFALENKRVPDVSQLPHVKGSKPSGWTANSGSSSHITPNQGGSIYFRPL